MAITQLTLNYDSILSTTLFNVRSQLYDNIFKTNAFWNWLHAKGRKRMVNGGERIQVALQYGTNSTVKSYSGYELLDTTPQDNVTSAFYPWKQIAGSVSISRKEERQNSGEAQILDLFRQKVRELELSMSETLSSQVLAAVPSGDLETNTGNSGKDLLPLSLLATDDGAGTVGGVVAGTETWWKNKFLDMDGTSYDTTVEQRQGFRKLYNDCSKGPGGGPDLALCDQSTFENYEAGLDEKTRFTDTTMANLGFDNIRLKGSMLFWDEVVPTGTDSGGAGSTTYDGTLYFLNSSFLELCVDVNTDLITSPFIRPENQDARTAQVLFMGELTTSNRRKQGVAFDIKTDPTIN